MHCNALHIKIVLQCNLTELLLFALVNLSAAMTSLFYRLYPKDAAIPDHSVTPAARWAKILANGGTLPEGETAEAPQEFFFGCFFEIMKAKVFFKRTWAKIRFVNLFNV